MTTPVAQVPKSLLGWLFTSRTGPLSSGAVMRWWEARRVPYNVIVEVVGLFSSAGRVGGAFTCESRGGAPIGLPDPRAFALVGVLLYGILANACYTGGW